MKNSKTMTKFKMFIPMQSEIVLAIDPGFDRIGLAVMKFEQNKPKLLFSQCLETDSKKARSERLFSIGQKIKSVIEEWRPETLAIETLFFNTNTTSAIGVAEARGIIIYEAKKANMKIFEYSPQAIKIAVTGYGRANKIQMAEMVKRLVNLPEKSSKRLDDEVDAIALGITHLATKNGI